MYVFDTIVLSEIMKDRPDPVVVDWLRQCSVDAMLTTTISQAEILYSVRRLPQGNRRDRLQAAAIDMFTRSFQDRILPFDSRAASLFATMRIERERAGRPITAEDGMIAAIAGTHGASVLTRHESGLAGCGVPVINPWKAT